MCMCVYVLEQEEDHREKEVALEEEELALQPAYRQAYFNTARCPLVSSDVVFDKKRSIVNDDDND